MRNEKCKEIIDTYLWSYKHPKSVVVMLLVITVFFPYYIPVVTSSNSTKSSWAKDDPAQVLYEEPLETFGSDKIIILFLTALTRFLGFLSIAMNSIVILHQFGLVCAFGLLANPLITFLVTPAFLRYFSPQQVSYEASGPISERLNGWFSRVADIITHLIHAYTWQTFGVVTGGILLLSLFTVTINIDNNFLVRMLEKLKGGLASWRPKRKPLTNTP